MTYLSDLHTHTTASDGQYSPGELVRLAKERGLQALAVTDHDTVGGAAEAVAAGNVLDLRVIPGVELCAKEYHNFHILGYSYTDGAPNLSRLCEKLRAGREDRKYKIIEFLQEKGVKLDLAEVEELAGDGNIGRPHFAQILVRRGYVANNREAFDRYLDSAEYRKKVTRFKADARTCIDTIKADGGKVSLAHPYQIGLDCEALDALVGQLAAWGLDAIECYYPKYTPEQQAFYLQLAEKYHLQRSGGSDFHGERVKPDVALAALELDLGWLLNDAPASRP